MSYPFPDLLTAFRRRGLALLRDETASSSRGVLVATAALATPELVNEVLHLGGGHLFVALSPQRANDFLLERMDRGITNQRGERRLDLLSSVEAREGVTTGISAADRARTIRILGEDTPRPRALVRPGHIFPLLTREGGVLVRNALPEGAIDLVQASGAPDAALLSDVLGPDGALLSGGALQAFAERHEIPHCSLHELTRFRLESERLVVRLAEARLPTTLAGELRSVVYRSDVFHGEHVALVKDPISSSAPTLTRVQPEFTFGDVFGGTTPPTREQIDTALRRIGERGSGVFIYLRRSEIGQLRQQVQQWRETFGGRSPALMREYGLGAQILRDLGIRRIDLLTNSRRNLVGLNTFGIEIVATTPLLEHAVSPTKEEHPL